MIFSRIEPPGKIKEKKGEKKKEKRGRRERTKKILAKILIN